jgi:Spy/CpxP family protein refolding chaperone
MRVSLRLAAIALAGALSLSVLTAASAQRRNGGFGGRRRGGVVLSQAWLDHLNLSADQQAKVKAATETYRADLEKARGLSGDERRQASQQARTTYQSALNAALNADQQKQLQAMRDEARELRDLGPMANQLVVLNLTDDQKSKIKAILSKHEPEIEKLRSSAQDGGDRTALRTQMRDLSQKMRDEVKAVLTADQQKQLGPDLPERRAGSGGV